VNDITTLVLRDTGSTTCVVKSSLVKPEQMTGSYKLCMLIDGVVKRYPTAIVDLDTPYYTGMTKVLCMDTLVQDIIVGNIPGARGPDTDTKPRDIKYTLKVYHRYTTEHRQSGETVPEIDKTLENREGKPDVAIEECAAVQTSAMVGNEKQPPKPLKVNSVPGWEVGPDEVKTKQKEDDSLKKYWDLVGKPVEVGKPQFFLKKDILHRKYSGKKDTDEKIQLVVPTELRHKVVSLAHNTLLAGHRGAGKTLSRVQQEFYWPGVHDYVTQYVASCDLCQRNVKKNSVAKVPMEKLPLVGTPFSMICMDIIGPISPPSEGYRYILTTIDM